MAAHLTVPSQTGSERHTRTWTRPLRYPYCALCPTIACSSLSIRRFSCCDRRSSNPNPCPCFGFRIGLLCVRVLSSRPHSQTRLAHFRHHAFVPVCCRTTVCFKWRISKVTIMVDCSKIYLCILKLNPQRHPHLQLPSRLHLTIRSRCGTLTRVNITCLLEDGKMRCEA